MKVLVVEDDNSSRLYLENLLEINGYNCKSAPNGMEGLNIFEEFMPDIVITDIQMPIMDGLEMLENIRARKTDTIVIITTVYGSENYAIQALHLGANNYLKKPVSGIDLLPLLRKYHHIKYGKFPEDASRGIVSYRKFKMEFSTNMANIPLIVDNILIESSCLNEDNDRINVELGLVELITNAFEHGNLEIDADDKLKALEENNLEALYAERLSRKDLKDRKIHIEFYMDRECCEWVIEDEGKGFDWRNIKDPTCGENLLGLSGRGIFISNFLFDEIQYAGRGNIVRVKKYFNPIND